MKRRGMFGTMILMVCLIITGVCFFPGMVSAKQNTAASQIKSLAKKQVKGAKIVKVEKEKEDGEIVYEVEMTKGKKEYDLVYRASDSKLISYGWETKSKYVKKGKGKLIGESKAKKFAKKQVKNASITSTTKKRSSGVDVYKVKMKDDSKKYELKLHARTGTVLEYDWELIVKTVKDNKDKDNNKDKNKDKDNSKNYIGEESAKQIALEEVGSGTIIKVEFDVDDGIAVYEIEIIEGNYEYEIKVHAESGIVLKVEREYKPNNNPSEEKPASRIGLEAAKAIALEDAGVSSEEVTYTKAELDHEDGIVVYDIEFFTTDYRYEYEINATTGAIRDKEVRRTYTGGGNNSGNNSEDTGTYIGLEQAKQIALEHVGTGRVVKAEFDMEDGLPIYEIEIVAGIWEYDIEIHAVTGSILKSEMEWMD